VIGHGSFDMWVDNQVLLARIDGAWNEEETRAYFKKMKQLTKEVIKQPWAQIVYLNDWELGTPENEQLTMELIQWSTEHNLKKTATVYSPHLIKQLQIERLKSNSINNTDYRSFQLETEAFAWLKSEGYAVNHPHLTAPDI